MGFWPYSTPSSTLTERCVGCRLTRLCNRLPWWIPPETHMRLRSATSSSLPLPHSSPTQSTRPSCSVSSELAAFHMLAQR